MLDGVPSPHEVRRWLESQQLNTWLFGLAGQQFGGRRSELAQLRDFVGVQPRTAVAKAIERILPGDRRKRPLSIHGVGGIGKTSLVAKLLLDNLGAPAETRFPFAYLDLGRAQFRTADPVVLLVEALDQLRREGPAAAAVIEHVASLMEAIQGPVRSYRNPIHPASGSEAQRALIDGLRLVVEQPELREKAFLAVLDSVEEVAIAGPAATHGLHHFVNALNSAIGSARIILIGRVPIEGFATDTLELGPLDTAGADAFLEARGVAPAERRAFIIRGLGGSPLTLALASRVVTEGDDLTDIGARASVFFRPGDDVIQATLFKRLLGHNIRPTGAEATTVAIVVRRVTPALITAVLAPGAGVNVPDDAAAADLFDKIGREVALFMPDEYGSIRARADLRARTVAIAEPE